MSTLGRGTATCSHIGPAIVQTSSRPTALMPSAGTVHHDRRYSGLMSAVGHSEGLTPSERHLKKLGSRSFLSLWSYANVYRDQGGGKELCDLLVIFGDSVVIFSDKHCAFPNSGDDAKDWSRWYQRAVAKSADQIFGAERWLRDHPGRIFVDSKCTVRLPIGLPEPGKMRVHRVVVALGASTRCQGALGDNGSLMLASPKGGQQVPPPFTVFPNVPPDKRTVHVFDEHSLDVVLDELDTIQDFLAYLRKKEALLASTGIQAPSEQDLLAFYLQNVNAQDEHDFVLPEACDFFGLQEGLWEHISEQPAYAAKKARDRPSYAWDRLIEYLVGRIASGDLTMGGDTELSTHELGLRVMAAERRVARRMLANAFLGLALNTPRGQPFAVRVVLSPSKAGAAYVFVLLKHDLGTNYDDYQRERLERLLAYVDVVKYLYRDLQHVVGIGTETQDSPGRSETMAYFDTSEWPAEALERGRWLHEVKGLMKSARTWHAHEREYPSLRQLSAPVDPHDARRRRNREKRRRRELRDKR